MTEEPSTIDGTGGALRPLVQRITDFDPDPRGGQGMSGEQFALQITEANHTDNAFWCLGVREDPRRLRILFEFNQIRGIKPSPTSECDYVLDMLENGDIVKDKFISKATAAALLSRSIDVAREQAKAALAEEIARYDARHPKESHNA